MDLAVTSDTGPIGDVRELAHELQEAAEVFGSATPSIAGTLVVCLRCLPADIGRRSLTRYERTEPSLLVALCVTEESVAGSTIAQQREVLGALLHDRIGKASRFRSVPWSPNQRAELRDGAEQLRTRLDGPRVRAIELCRAGYPLDEIAEATGLDLDEGENLFADTRSDRHPL